MAMALQTGAGATSWAASVAHVLDTTLDTIALWRQRAFTRRELSRLDDRMLQDIGITHYDVECEVTKPFWKA